MNPKNKVRERVESLPDSVWDCERCESADAMQIRRSSLNTSFYADDVGLKCKHCRYYATHGIPFESPAEFSKELKARDGRVIDFARDTHNPSESLAALGYVAKAEDIDNGD